MPLETFHDAHGREVLTRTWGSANLAILEDHVYDSHGWLAKKSNPQTNPDRQAGSYGARCRVLPLAPRSALVS